MTCHYLHITIQWFIYSLAHLFIHLMCLDYLQCARSSFTEHRTCAWGLLSMFDIANLRSLSGIQPPLAQGAMNVPSQASVKLGQKVHNIHPSCGHVRRAVFILNVLIQEATGDRFMDARHTASQSQVLVSKSILQLLDYWPLCLHPARASPSEVEGIW